MCLMLAVVGGPKTSGVAWSSRTIGSLETVQNPVEWAFWKVWHGSTAPSFGESFAHQKHQQSSSCLPGSGDAGWEQLLQLQGW